MLNMEILCRTKAGKWLMSHSKRANIKAVISIGDPGQKFPAGFGQVHCPKIRLEFDDVDREDEPLGGGGTVTITKADGTSSTRPMRTWSAPCEEDIAKIIKFANLSKGFENGTCVVHCFAGLSRSTAAGLILHSVWLGPGQEEEAMARTLAACRQKDPWPNELMVRIADRLLDRNGALVAAHQKIMHQAA